MLSKKISPQGIYGFAWSDICLFLAIATIPWGNNVNSWALILFSVTAFFKNSFKDKKALLARSRYWLLPVAYYFIVAASLLWDKNGWGAIKMMEKHTSFLILPFIIASLPALPARVIKTALLLFVFSITIICISCLVLSFAEYRITGDSRVFFYHYLSKQMNLNAIYLSLFALFSILVLLFYCYIDKSPLTSAQRMVQALTCVFLSFMVMVLSAKMPTFLFFLFVPATVLYIFYLKRMLLKGILLGFLLAAGSIFLLWQLPYTKWRIEVTIFKKYEGAADNQNGLAARQLIWQSAASLIAQKPLLGYGVKNGSEQLVEEYKRRDFVLGYESRYDAHDVYLQLLLNTGIIGLLPILLMLAMALIKALQQRNFLLFCVTVILIAESVTESLLEVQEGIVFFLLFLLLLYYHSPAGFKRKSVASPVLSPVL